MAGYDSDSSFSDLDTSSDIQTNVTLGYASQEPTDDLFSQLGGHASFFSYKVEETPNVLPSASLARCKICNTNMSLLLQLQGDMKSRFPSHERRLYLWTCRRKACRRKEGSVRGFRGLRTIPGAGGVASSKSGSQATQDRDQKAQPTEKDRRDIGGELFGGKSSPAGVHSSNPFSTAGSTAAPNPFATLSSSSNSNPFSSAPAPPSTLAVKTPQPPSATQTSQAQDGTASDLPATFASKARISSPSPSSTSSKQSAGQPHEPWPSYSSLPTPYPIYHLDADAEYLSPTSSTTPAQPNGAGPSTSHKAFLDSGMDVDDPASSSKSSGKDTEAEADMYTDRTFQHFAERVAQNDEQVLRYEFGGAPLLYSSTDAVGRMLSSNAHAPNGSKIQTLSPSGSQSRSIGGSVPRCTSCNGKRTFEFQLMPRAIVELECEMDPSTVMSEGMEWGTIVFYSCENDCLPDDAVETDAGFGDGKVKVGYSEEWVGVQWEEVVKRK